MINDKKKRKTVNYNEKYSQEVQLFFISMLLYDPHAFAICRTILKEDYFDDSVKPAITFILEHADKYKTLPTHEMIKNSAKIAVDKLNEPVPTDFILDEIEGFCKYKAHEICILDGVELLQEGRSSEIVERVKEASQISLNRDLGTNYFEDPEERLKRILDKSGYVSTGWQVLDNKLYGGFTRGGLNIFAGGSGSGKSLFLQNLAVNWAMVGLNVLYFSLELSEELVSLRIDAMVTEKGTSEILKDVQTTVIRIRNKQRTEKPGLLYIKKLPEGGTTVNDIRAYVKEFQITKGLKPDAILIDYLDLMYPTNSRIDISDHFIKDKMVSEEIRGLMGETNTIGATASQLNRCLFLDTIVTEEKRGNVRIDSLKVGEKVLGTNGFTTVKAIDKPTSQKAFLIKTKSGKSIICSKNHRFPTNNGLLAIENGLSVGYKINTKG